MGGAGRYSTGVVTVARRILVLGHWPYRGLAPFSFWMEGIYQRRNFCFAMAAELRRIFYHEYRGSSVGVGAFSADFSTCGASGSLLIALAFSIRQMHCAVMCEGLAYLYFTHTTDVAFACPCHGMRGSPSTWV